MEKININITYGEYYEAFVEGGRIKLQNLLENRYPRISPECFEAVVWRHYWDGLSSKKNFQRLKEMIFEIVEAQKKDKNKK